MIDLYKVFYKNAGVAQLVEQLICNQQVAGSSPIASFFTSYFIIFLLFGEIPKWPKGTDCKSVGIAFEGSNPSLPRFYLFSSFIIKKQASEPKKW